MGGTLSCLVVVFEVHKERQMDRQIGSLLIDQLSRSSFCFPWEEPKNNQSLCGEGSRLYTLMHGTHGAWHLHTHNNDHGV